MAFGYRFCEQFLFENCELSFEIFNSILALQQRLPGQPALFELFLHPVAQLVGATFV